MNRLAFLALAGLLALFPSFAQAAAAATAGLVEGDPVLQRDGASRPLDEGMEIDEGDLIETGKGGHVELDFRDGSRIALAEKTRFRVRRYDYDSEKKRPGTGLFDLLTGALRGITGAITADPAHRFEISTDVATIGIRGTEFTGEIDDSNLNVAMLEGKGVFVRTPDGTQSELDRPNVATRVHFRRDRAGKFLIDRPERVRALEQREIARLNKRVGWRDRVEHLKKMKKKRHRRWRRRE